MLQIVMPHHCSTNEAREKIESLLHNLEQRYGGYISDVSQSWTGDELNFRFKAKGATAEGRVVVTSDEIIIDGKLPLIAWPFERKIREMIEREGERLFGSA